MDMEGLEDLPLDGNAVGVDSSDSSEDELNSSMSDDEDSAAIIEGLSVTEDEVTRNYQLLGTGVSILRYFPMNHIIKKSSFLVQFIKQLPFYKNNWIRQSARLTLGTRGSPIKP